MKAGIRRNLIRCILTPIIILYQLVKYRKIMGTAFWDILGFAEFINAIKIKDL